MSIADEQRELFLKLYRKYGDDPRSLSHNDPVTQHERFRRIARCFERATGAFTVHEIGCGLGHFGRFLAEQHPRALYSGSEICEEFVEHCRRRFPDGDFFLRDVSRQLPEDRYDFVTVSGTFNIRQNRSKDEWEEWLFSMLRAMYAMATKGIAADFLSTYHDPEYAQAALHYQDEKRLMDFFVSDLTRHFELDSGSPLYEYTIRAYHPDYLRSLYPEREFDRYFR